MPTPPVSLEPRISDLVVESQIEATWDPTTEQTTHIRTAVGVSARRRRLKTEEIWKRKRILGRGAFGTVWLEERIASSGPSHGDESNLRAIKEIRKRAKISAYEFHRELEAIAKFSHQRFVHCFTRSLGWFENEESLFITMEYIKYGDLQHYLTKPFPEPEVRQIALQIAEALQLMHDSGFAHRDLKPSNIMVFQKGPAWWVKLADFGISKRVEESTVLRTMEIGTRGFMAPEILGLYCPDDFDDEELEDDDDEGVHDALSYTPAVDLWALGEITHRLLTQKPAFIANKRLWSYVTKGTPFPANELQVAGTSAQGIKFIQEAMAASPKGRLTAEDAINHEWLENHEFIDEERSRSSTESDRELHPSGMTVSDYEPSAEWTVTGRDSNAMAERSTEPSTVVPDEAPVALVGEALTVLPGEAATTIHDETDTFLSDEAPPSFPAEELAGKQAEATTEQRGEPSVISDDRKLPEGEFEALTLAESHSEAIQDDTSQTIVGDQEIPVTDSRNHPRRFSFPELPFHQEPPGQVSTDSVTDMTASPPQEELLTTPLAHESLESSHQIENDTSQPIKRDLKSWWRGFKSPSKQRDNHSMPPTPRLLTAIPFVQPLPSLCCFSNQVFICPQMIMYSQTATLFSFVHPFDSSRIDIISH
ncbi:kinase-like domain-containing protein [Dactylonectria macrodidyma]|uniref:Autophagy-related protein 1 n=1 Tax=Dactylonectria macrodidyma TaxID=307937 RepID=A0A9P9F6P2_9HYPO|nr:kinase-like domain-containing protein [Dactylonectria macrodidyma]